MKQKDVSIFTNLASTSTISQASCSIKRRKRQESLDEFIDTVSDKKVNEFHKKLSSFFFGCNIPFNVIQSDHFKDLIKFLRSAYALHLPKRKALSTTLLEKEYERCVILSKELIDSESVLLIDGWKNTFNNTKTVVTMLHNAKGSTAFVNAWDVTEDYETSDKLIEIVNESIQIAKTLYESTVYAVVSDNAAAMIKMGKNITIWHSNCSSHTANLLAKDVLNKTYRMCQTYLKGI